MDKHSFARPVVGAVLMLTAVGSAQAAVWDIASLSMESTELELEDSNGALHEFETKNLVTFTFATPGTFVEITDNGGHTARIYSTGTLSGQADGDAGKLTNMDFGSLMADFGLGSGTTLTLALWDNSSTIDDNEFDESTMRFEYGWTTTYANNVAVSICMGDANTSCSTGAVELEGTVNPVPVPAALWLFGSGLLGLVGAMRRKAA